LIACASSALRVVKDRWRHAAFEQGDNPLGLKLMLYHVFMTSANG
jgi:hypothetical protein